METAMKPLPDPAVNNWETAPIEDLRTEVKALRLWSANLFMEVKGWRNRMNELAAASEQILKLRSEDEFKYIALSNKTQELQEDVQTIIEALGLNDSEAPDDTPQPPF